MVLAMLSPRILHSLVTCRKISSVSIDIDDDEVDTGCESANVNVGSPTEGITEGQAKIENPNL